jgi:hypothetical protein
MQWRSHFFLNGGTPKELLMFMRSRNRFRGCLIVTFYHPPPPPARFVHGFAPLRGVNPLLNVGGQTLYLEHNTGVWGQGRR